VKPVLSICILVVMMATFAWGQQTVDATGPVRRRHNEPTSGSGGGVGRKMSLLVAMAVVGGWDDQGKIEIDFTLTNVGKRPLTIPVSPNSGDVEPPDPKASYSIECLNLRVAPYAKQERILPGGVDLYGRAEISGTLMKLNPGSSVRVATRVALPRVDSVTDGTIGFVASAMLNHETITGIDGQTVSDAQEIGSAYSREYKLNSLLGVPR
jgi:hypothetical protein